MKKLIYQLNVLKKLGVVAIKQSLEDEGASFEEISLMIKISKKLGLNLNVKIGGCEAKNDIFFCTSIGSNGIVAPMIESEYGLKKFIQVLISFRITRAFQRKGHCGACTIRSSVPRESLSNPLKVRFLM